MATKTPVETVERIQQLLLDGKSYNFIVKQLLVSKKTIAKVAKMETVSMETIPLEPMEPVLLETVETAPMEPVPLKTMETAPMEPVPLEIMETVTVEPNPLEILESAPMETVTKTTVGLWNPPPYKGDPWVVDGILTDAFDEFFNEDKGKPVTPVVVKAPSKPTRTPVVKALSTQKSDMTNSELTADELYNMFN